MLDMDVNDGTDDLNFRKSDVAAATGRLLGTNTGFVNVPSSGPDNAYAFAPNTQYTGSFTITRISATEMELAGALDSATHSVTSTFDSASFGMLAFWANSNNFGSSNTPDTADNGIDFSNIKVEFCAGVPEASSICLALLGAIGTLAQNTTRRRRV